MIEVRLVTGCVQYEQAWKGLLPQLWEYTKKHNPDCVKINSEAFDGESDRESDGDIDEELDDG